MATDIIARAIGKSAKDKTDKITVNNNINLDIVSSTLADNVNQLTKLSEDLNVLDEELFKKYNIKELVELNIQKGYYRYTNFKFVSDSRRTAIIDVNPGETYQITTQIRSTAIAGIIFATANDAVIGYDLVGTGVDQDIIDYRFTIPPLCTKIAVQNTNTKAPIVYKVITQKIRKTGNEYCGYGLRWKIDDNDDLGERCFTAIGMNAQIGIGATDGYSDFDNIYPWSQIKRCNIKTNANGASVITYEGEDGFALDGSNGDVFVRIPKFNILRYVEDGYEYRVIGVPGTPVHEAFIENGKVLDEIFVAAFEGYIDSNGKLRSIAGVIPTSNEVPATFLSAATANGSNYSLYDIRCVDAIWTLMAVEYGCRNTNRIIGYGVANYAQPTNATVKMIVESATNTNSVKVAKMSNYYKDLMPVGSNITICDTEQTEIIAQRRIISVEDTEDNLYTVFTFDGDGIDVNTSCFIGSAALNTNFCEDCPSGAMTTYHTGRANWIKDSNTQNPIRYRWIENVVGNLWHFLPDVTFRNLQMYYCNNMQDYEFHKYTAPYIPVGNTLIENVSNGNKSDIPGENYWIDQLLNDTFAKAVPFGKSYDKSLVSTKAFGAYYYLNGATNTAYCIANGGGFDHLYRCNMLTNRAWITNGRKWYLYGARMMFKKIQ